MAKINFKKYLYSSSGSLLIFIIWFSFLVMNIESNWEFYLIPLFIFMIFTALIAHHSLYYFTITEHEIIIKNLCFFWFTRSFKIENIAKITKIQKNTTRGAWNGVIISLKETVEGHKFYMDSFKEDFWKILEKELNNLNINFDDKS